MQFTVQVMSLGWAFHFGNVLSFMSGSRKCDYSAEKIECLHGINGRLPCGKWRLCRSQVLKGTCCSCSLNKDSSVWFDKGVKNLVYG